MKSVFKSIHPDVARFADELRARFAIYHEMMRPIKAEFPGYDLGESFSIIGKNFLGLSTRKDGEATPCPGNGWHQNRTGDWWVPKQNTKEGKRMAREFAKIAIKFPAVPGMPYDIIDLRRSVAYRPSFQQYGGVFWCSWGCDSEEVEAENDFSPLIWDTARLSEFYAAKETDVEGNSNA